MNLWLSLGLLAPICWALNNVIDTVLRRHYLKDNFVAAWFLGLGRLPLFVGIFLFMGIEFPGISAVLLIIIAGFLWIYAHTLYYKALEFEEPSRVTLLEQTIPIFTLIISFFVLHETLTVPQGIIFLLILTGGSFAAIRRSKITWHFSKAFWIILVENVLFALSYVLFKKFEPDFSGFWHAFSFFLFGGFLFSIVTLFPTSGRKMIMKNMVELPMRGWRFIIINFVVGITGLLAFAYALTLGKASLTGVLLGIQPFLTFISGFTLAPFFHEVHREEINKQSLIFKSLSFILIIVGLILLQKYTGSSYNGDV